MVSGTGHRLTVVNDPDARGANVGAGLKRHDEDLLVAPAVWATPLRNQRSLPVSQGLQRVITLPNQGP